MLQGGAWQQFKLPDSWVREHWRGDAPRRVYLMLRPPAVGDYGVFTPCTPPPQLVVGVVDESREAREHLLACPDACRSREGAPELWGYRTHLLGIGVSLLGDGSIEISEHYQQLAQDAPDDASGPGRFTSASTGEERVRHDRIAPAALAVAVSRSEPITTCHALLEP